MSAPILEFKTAVLQRARAEGSTPARPQGIVEALVAVTGVRDDVGDIITPGAFTRTLKSRPSPKVCLGHDWNRPIGKTLDIKELMPGDPRLPKTTVDGQPWPKEAGALWARFQYNLNTKDGKAAFEDADFQGLQGSAYSIGYRTLKARHLDDARHLDEVDLWEYSQVLNPANRLATLQSIKSGARPEDLEHRDNSASLEAMEVKATRYVRDAAFWGLPLGTIIRPGMKPRGKIARARAAAGKPVREDRGVVEVRDGDIKLKVTAKGKAKRSDGAYESAIVGGFLDAVRHNDRPEVAADALIVEDDGKYTQGDKIAPKAGEYNPLDMLIANAVVPSELEETLRGWQERGDWDDRRVGDSKDPERAKEIDEFIAEVMDEYRERYNAALVEQRAPKRKPTKPKGEDRAAEVEALSMDAETLPVDEIEDDDDVLADARRIVGGLNSDLPDWDDAKTDAVVDGLVKADRHDQARFLEGMAARAEARAAGEQEPDLVEDRGVSPTLAALLPAVEASSTEGEEVSTDRLAGMRKAEATAAAANMSDAELAAHDAELGRRATELGQGGKRSAAHQAVVDEIERREGDGARPSGERRADKPGDTPVTELSDAELDAERDAVNKRLLTLGNFGASRVVEPLRERARVLMDEKARRARGVILTYSRPEDRSTTEPTEYVKLRKQATENQYSARDEDTNAERHEKTIKRIDESEAIAANAPESIPDNAVPEGGTLVANGRLIAKGAGKATWALYAATGTALVNARSFTDAENPRRTVKLNARQIDSLGRALASIVNRNGDRIPTTATTNDWGPGFRDAHGRDGREAIHFAVTRWADQNGLDVPDHIRRGTDGPLPWHKRPRPLAPTEADEQGFHHFQPGKYVSVGDTIKTYDGAEHVVSAIRREREPAGGRTHAVFVFEDGGEYAPGTASIPGVKYANGRPDPASNTRMPGMGWENATLGLPITSAQAQSIKPLVEYAKGGLPAGTRILYRSPEDSFTGRHDDTRPRVGTVTDRFMSVPAADGWFQVVEWDDGTNDALDTPRMVSKGTVTVDPSAEEVDAARAEWGLPPLAASRVDDEPSSTPEPTATPEAEERDTSTRRMWESVPRVAFNRLTAQQQEEYRRLDEEGEIEYQTIRRAGGSHESALNGALTLRARRAAQQEAAEAAAAAHAARRESAVPYQVVRRPSRNNPTATILFQGRTFEVRQTDGEAAEVIVIDDRGREFRQAGGSTLEPRSERQPSRERALRAALNAAVAAPGPEGAVAPESTVAPTPVKPLRKLTKMQESILRGAQRRRLRVSVGRNPDHSSIWEDQNALVVTGNGNSINPMLLGGLVTYTSERDVYALTPEGERVAAELGSTSDATTEITPAVDIRDVADIDDAELERRLVAARRRGSELAASGVPANRTSRSDARTAIRILEDEQRKRAARAASTSDTPVRNETEERAAARQAAREERDQAERERVARLLAERGGRRGVRARPESEAEISASEIDEAAVVRDEVLGIVETPDGEIEVTEEVAQRQDRVERLLGADAAGSLNLGEQSTETLIEERTDLRAELRLQAEVARRDALARRQRAPRAPRADGEPVEPRVRPGLAGAAQDHAEALESGDEEAIQRTRRRLESSLRRSRADSDAARALADAMRDGTDASELTDFAGRLRSETRERRNAAARKRRTVKRLERERIRSLLGKVDAELRGRGVQVPDDLDPSPNATTDAPVGGPSVDAPPPTDPPIVAVPEPSEPSRGRATEMAATLRAQPWLLLGSEVVAGENREERERAASAAFGPVAERYLPTLDGLTDDEIDAEMAVLRERGGDVPPNMLGWLIARKLPEADARRFVADVKTATGVFTASITRARTREREQVTEIEAPKTVSDLEPERAGHRGRTDVLGARRMAARPLGNAPFESLDDALGWLSAQQPGPDIEEGYYRQHFVTARDKLVSDIRAAGNNAFLSPGGGLIAFRSPHKSTDGRVAWNIVHSVSGRHIGHFEQDNPLGTRGNKFSGSTPPMLYDLDAPAMRRMLDGLERVVSPHGQQVDWTREEADVAAQVRAWQDYAPDGHLPSIGTGGWRSGNILGLTRAATAHAVRDEPRKYAGTSTFGLLHVSPNGSERVNDRDGGFYLDRSFNLVESELNFGKIRRTWGTDRRTTEELREDKETGRVVSEARLKAFSGRPHEAYDLLTARAGEVRELRGRWLRGLAEKVAEFFSPVPTEDERLDGLRVGDMIASAEGEDAPPRVWEVVEVPDVRRRGRGRGGETSIASIELRTDDGREGTLTVWRNDRAQQFRAEIFYADGGRTEYLSIGGAGNWAVFPRGAGRPTTSAQVTEASRRAVRAFQAEGSDRDPRPVPDEVATVVATPSPASLDGNLPEGGPSPVSVVDPSPASTVETRIREAYEQLSVKPQDWVRLAKLRPLLADLDRAEVDAAMLRLVKTGNVHLAPDSNRKVLTADDHAAAINTGADDLHIIAFEPDDPSVLDGVDPAPQVAAPTPAPQQGGGENSAAWKKARARILRLTHPTELARISGLSDAYNPRNGGDIAAGRRVLLDAFDEDKTPVGNAIYSLLYASDDHPTRDDLIERVVKDAMPVTLPSNPEGTARRGRERANALHGAAEAIRERGEKDDDAGRLFVGLGMDGIADELDMVAFRIEDMIDELPKKPATVPARKLAALSTADLIGQYDLANSTYAGRFTDASPVRKRIARILALMEERADRGDPEALAWYEAV